MTLNKMDSDMALETLWTKPELDATFKTNNAVNVTGVSFDSRSTQAGDLFFALHNEKDGHDFVAAAAKAGAVAAVVQHQVPGVTIPQLVVPSTFAALQNLGCAATKRHTGKRLAVTGSAGKTTVKEMLALMLAAHKPEKSYNNHWGVPLTLSRLPEKKPFGVFEIGTSTPGEIAPLSAMVAPHVAGVTVIGGAHMAGFGTLAKLAVEKLSIASGLTADGILVVPHAISKTYASLMPARILTYSAEIPTANAGAADIFITRHTATPTGQHVVAQVAGQTVSFTLNVLGAHMLHNSLLALGMAHAAGSNVAEAAKKLAEFLPVDGRGNTQTINSVLVIDESFNANPLSMQAALETFQSLPVSGRKIALLGDMLELGEHEQEDHKNLAQHCQFLDGVATVGPLSRHLFNALPAAKRLAHAETAPQLNLADLNLQAGDAVLVKGSKKMFWVHQFVDKVCAHVQNSVSSPTQKS